MLPILLILGAWTSGPEVLRVKGLVVVDEKGKDRILIGSPIPKSDSRSSPAHESGIVLVDDNGKDRLAIGETTQVEMGGKWHKRDRAYSVLIFDRKGDERGGFGTFDDGKAVVVLDRARPDSDGVALVVDEVSDFVGFSANHRQKNGQYEQAIALGVQRGNNFFNLDDPNGKRRFSLVLPATGDPKGLIYPLDGGEGRDVFKPK